MEAARVHGAVAEEADADVAVAFEFRRMLQRPADADRQGDIAADDAVAAREAVLFVEQVHRAAFAARDAGAFAVDLGHQFVRVAAQDQAVGMVAVGRQGLVARLVGVQDAQRDRFLADVKMQVAADFAGAERPVALLFEVADVQHLLIGVQEVVVAEFERLDDCIRRSRLEADAVRVIAGGARRGLFFGASSEARRGLLP